MQEGYDKYKGQMFKVANLNYWLIIVSGPHLVEQVRQAPEDVLSFSGHINDVGGVYTIRDLIVTTARIWRYAILSVQKYATVNPIKI